MVDTRLGRRIFVSIMLLFVAFAAVFIVFQYSREKEYKVSILEVKLQEYNAHLADVLGTKVTDEQAMSHYVVRHTMPSLRVTVIRNDGTVVFDNIRKDYARMQNHANRAEVRQALRHGSSSAVERNSRTLNQDYFYSATYFPQLKMVVRSALPYNGNLSKSLETDRSYLWLALAVLIVLSLVLYRFARQLGENIKKLNIFATRADRNESLETEDLAAFPEDELGEIAERIIKIYKRLQSTRQEQDILKRQLTQNIAHELKTPVASIQGYIDTLIDYPDIDDATRQQFLGQCRAQTSRLTALLHDISTLNRMDYGAQMMQKEPTDINLLVDDIQKESALQLAHQRMTFCNELPQGILIHGVHDHLYSIFRNLTDNALAYAGEGTTITLTAERHGDAWRFAFADNGIGVPQQHLARLFERFYRVDKGRSRKLGGTGLGLAIVKNAVIEHGGTITAVNHPNGGLQFVFTLSIGEGMK